MDTNALFKIGYGLYVLTSNYENIDNGCIINTVIQITDEPLRIAVVVNKKNYTHELILNSCVFNLSMLTTETPFKVIEHFGFQSGKDINKFADCQQEFRSKNNVLYIPKYTNSYISCHVVSHQDLGTHTMFFADVIDSEVLSEKESLTYSYYQNNIKPKKETNGKKGWYCKICGWVHEDENLPDDIICPLCKHGKDAFEKIEDDKTTEIVETKQNIDMLKINLTNDIYYVGVNDRKTELFENHMELPNGVSYNSYLIVDEKIALIDPVEVSFMAEFLFKIKSVIGDRKIDYLVINHDEPDHSGAVRAIVQEYPDVEVIGNAKTFAPLESFYGPLNNKKIVAEGETLCLGKHTLQFFMVPMCHWPESMVTYEQTNKILFSNDAFGGFGALNGCIFDDEANLDFYEDDMRRYYANIVGKVAAQAVKTVQKLGPLDIKMIAPSHGLVWRSNLHWVLDRYVRWSTGENEEGVVIVYGSMYGNTALMADIIARGVSEAGVKNIKIYDVAKTEVSHIISDIWKYKGAIIGACAHYGSVFPNMTLLLHELTEFKPKNKVYGVFGGMSWGGGGVKYINNVMEKNQWECPVESIEVKGAPYRDKDVERLYNMGKTIGERVINS